MKIKIEIVIAIFITLLLLVLCVDKFFDLKTQARQGLNEKNFTTLNDALSVYRGDNEGRCPETLDELVPVYLDKIPPVYTYSGKEIFEIKNTDNSEVFDKNTAWIYINDKASKDYCKIFKKG